jgi:hypothetical protein
MVWLSNHFWLLFSGVGGTLLVSLFIFFLQRRPESERGAELTIRDSQLTGSPVASGSQITQHNYFTPVPTPVPVAPLPAATAPTVYTRPRPNIRQTNVKAFAVNEYGLPLRITEDRTGKAQTVVIEFTNEAVHEKVNVGATIKASLVFENNDVGVLRTIGSWLRSDADVKQFDVEDTHHLIVGFFHNQRVQTLDMRTAGGYMRPEVHFVPPFQTVRVKLTDASIGDLFYEGRFRVTLDPLNIAPNIEIPYRREES